MSAGTQTQVPCNSRKWWQTWTLSLILHSLFWTLCLEVFQDCSQWGLLLWNQLGLEQTNCLGFSLFVSLVDFSHLGLVWLGPWTWGMAFPSVPGPRETIEVWAEASGWGTPSWSAPAAGHRGGSMEQVVGNLWTGVSHHADDIQACEWSFYIIWMTHKHMSMNSATVVDKQTVEEPGRKEVQAMEKGK